MTIKRVQTIILGIIAQPTIFEQVHALAVVFFVSLHFCFAFFGFFAVSGGFELADLMTNLSILSEKSFSGNTILLRINIYYSTAWLP